MRITSTYELGPDEVVALPDPEPQLHGDARCRWRVERDAVRPRHDPELDRPVDARVEGGLAGDGVARCASGSTSASPPAGTASGLINYENDGWGHTGTIQNTHAMVLHQPDG